MSAAASPRKPWESSAATPGAAQPLAPSTHSAALAVRPPPGASDSLNDAFALVPASSHPASAATQPSTAAAGSTGTSASIASPSAPSSLPPYDPRAQLAHSASPYGQHLSPYSPLLAGGVYGAQPPPGLAMPYNPLTHIGTSIQSFGRFSQLLQLNFDALHMSFSSLLRLFDSYSMLRQETVMLGQTFTALNVFAVVGRKVWRVLEWMLGRRELGDMERGWVAAAEGVAGAAEAGKGAAASSSFFSGWTWTFLFIAIGWSVVRWCYRQIRRRLFPQSEFPPSATILNPTQPQPAGPQQPGAPAPADPSNTNPAAPHSALPVPNGVGALPSYSSPYSTVGYGAGAYGMTGLGGYAGGYGGGLSGYGAGLGGYGGAYGGGYGSGYGGGLSSYGAVSGMYGPGGYGIGGLGY